MFSFNSSLQFEDHAMKQRLKRPTRISEEPRSIKSSFQSLNNENIFLNTQPKTSIKNSYLLQSICLQLTIAKSHQALLFLIQSFVMQNSKLSQAAIKIDFDCQKITIQYPVVLKSRKKFTRSNLNMLVELVTRTVRKLNGPDEQLDRELQQNSAMAWGNYIQSSQSVAHTLRKNPGVNLESSKRQIYKDYLRSEEKSFMCFEKAIKSFAGRPLQPINKPKYDWKQTCEKFMKRISVDSDAMNYAEITDVVRVGGEKRIAQTSRFYFKAMLLRFKYYKGASSNDAFIERSVVVKIPSEATDKREMEKITDYATHENELLRKKFSLEKSGSLLKYFYDINNKILYSGYCKHGDMSAYLSRTETYLTLSTKLWMLYQATEAVMTIHNLKLVHCDIKLENIFVAEGLWIKLADFETAVEQNNFLEVEKSRVRGCTIPHSPPELYDNSKKSINKKVDIYALGICYIHLLFPKIFRFLYSKVKRKQQQKEDNQNKEKPKLLQIVEKKNQKKQKMQQQEEKEYYDSRLFYREFCQLENLECWGPPMIISSLFNIIKKCISPNPDERPSVDMMRVESRAMLETLRCF